MKALSAGFHSIYRLKSIYQAIPKTNRALGMALFFKFFGGGK
jgi:hypothetical protein